MKINNFYIEKLDNESDFRKKYMKVSEFELNKGSTQKDSWFLDVHGNKYVVDKLTKLRRSYSILDVFSPHPWFYVSYELKMPELIAFEEAKKTVFDIILANKWYTQGGETKSEFISRINRTNDFVSLFNEIDFYGHI